jgi:mevalonate kinase
MNSRLRPVCASAPGKVILFGEHSVVYGQPAVAAALSDLRIVVLLTPHHQQDDNDSTGSAAKIRVILPDLPVDCQLPTSVLWAVKDQLKAPPTAQCSQLLDQVVRNFGQTRQGRDITDQSTIHAILPLLYLISQLAPTFMLEQSVGCTVQVRSINLPVGAGLGSSAAFGVACAAALWQWHEPLGDSTVSSLLSSSSLPVTPSLKSLQEINRCAFYSEILLHGRPSGIDNTVSCQGGALLFTRSHHEVSLQPLPMPQQQPPLHLLLVYTHVPRHTKQLVAAVRALYDAHPTIVTPILQAMGQIATTFGQLVVDSGAAASASLSKQSTWSLSTVLTLVRTNQSLLTALGVSHPSLDRICTVVQQVCPDQAAAKLTGAGGGGCAMIVLDSTSTGTKLRETLVAALQAAARPDYQFDFLSSTVGGDGVLYVPPSQFPPTLVRSTTRRSRAALAKWLPTAAILAATSTAVWVLSQRRKGS